MVGGERTLPSTSPSPPHPRGGPTIPWVVHSTTISATTVNSTTTTTISPTPSHTTRVPETRKINRTLAAGATNHSAVIGAIPTPRAQDNADHVIETPLGDRVDNHSANSGVVIAGNNDKSGQYLDNSVVERDDHGNNSANNELDHRLMPSNGTDGERREVVGLTKSDEVRVVFHNVDC